MALTIRPATRDDLPALGRMGASLMRTHYQFDPLRFLAPGEGAESGYAAFLGSILRSEEGRVFIAIDEDVVVGYVYAALEPLSWKELRGPAGFIHDILVSDEARGRGIATALLERAIAWLEEAGVPRVVLWTAAPNEAAQRLFAHFGFRTTMFEMTKELE